MDFRIVEEDRMDDVPRVPRIEIEVKPKEEPDALWFALLVLCCSFMLMLYAMHGWTGLVEAIEAGMAVVK